MSPQVLSFRGTWSARTWSTLLIPPEPARSLTTQRALFMDDSTGGGGVNWFDGFLFLGMDLNSDLYFVGGSKQTDGPQELGAAPNLFDQITPNLQYPIGWLGGPGNHRVDLVIPDWYLNVYSPRKWLPPDPLSDEEE